MLIIIYCLKGGCFFITVLNKTIRVDCEVHELLSNLANKNTTFNDVIKDLIQFYNENGQHKSYNVEKNFSGENQEITLLNLEKRVEKLEKELNKNI